ncbi:hypothetical protein Y5S_03733 [Alcanivorax nanhaiticus]|jgi:CRISPR type IV-associated protein Csf3|uniref:Uncharacterized protein n=1 Tax=Alcanivorax nanhaiticus TaxID=1177154 RepID=A0A095UFX1_9GAMM|nr:type IV CRISPR-associated protein Csf3 [Alcanivorax nanhaiticus]KGD61395.1 hypothetical protein Y5S_03733 [Alcanivorax nanhaiticus]
MEPLKVTFKLGGMMVMPPNPIHLDSLIAYAVTQERLPELEFDPRPISSLAEDLPIEKYEQDGDWCWKASAITPTRVLERSSRHYTQRIDENVYAEAARSGFIQAGRKRGEMKKMSHAIKIDTLRGSQRNLLGFYRTVRVDELVGYVIGDKEQITYYLKESGLITHIGPRRRQGHGKIVDVIIESDELAFENWMIRVKPFKMLDADVEVLATTKPPYFDKTLMQPAFIPDFI